MRQPTAPYRSLTDAELVEILYTAGDQVPREVVEEFLRRGTKMVYPLQAVVSDKAAWTQPLPAWWAVVHASYILGALETEAALVPLLIALRWADAFDCDWVTEDLPAMFGRLGPTSWPPLAEVLHDGTAGPGARSVALASLAAVSLAAPSRRAEVLGWAVALVAHTDEDLHLRRTAANVLVDFRCRDQRELLFQFGREEALRKREDPEYQGVFYDWEVDELLTSDAESSLEYYRRDWLIFYDPDEMARRQERWRREQEEEEREELVKPAADRDLDEPCRCGSGRPFSRCCYLRVH